MKEKECSVCAKAGSSYKCAQCRIPYCSVACYKTHKDICNKAAPVNIHKPGPEAARGSTDSAGGAGVRGTESIILHASQLAALDKDPEIQRLLRSERLKEHIHAVDSAPDRCRALKRVRSSHPEFDEFVAKSVSVVSNRDLQTGMDELRRAAQELRKAEVARLIEEARVEASGQGEQEEEEEEEEGQGEQGEEEGEGEGEIDEDESEDEDEDGDGEEEEN